MQRRKFCNSMFRENCSQAGVDRVRVTNGHRIRRALLSIRKAISGLLPQARQLLHRVVVEQQLPRLHWEWSLEIYRPRPEQDKEQRPERRKAHPPQPPPLVRPVGREEQPQPAQQLRPLQPLLLREAVGMQVPQLPAMHTSSSSQRPEVSFFKSERPVRVKDPTAPQR